MIIKAMEFPMDVSSKADAYLRQAEVDVEGFIPTGYKLIECKLQIVERETRNILVVIITCIREE